MSDLNEKDMKDIELEKGEVEMDELKDVDESYEAEEPAETHPEINDSESFYQYRSSEDLSKVMYESELQKKEKRGKWTKFIALVLIGSVTGGFSVGAGSEFMRSQLGGTGIYGQPYYEAVNTNGNSDSNGEQLAAYNNSDKDIVKIAESVGPSVVAITSKVAYQDYFNNVSYSSGAGSGVIFKIDAQNVYILTNNHVIENAEELVVELKKDIYGNAEVVGRDKSTDIAIIKVALKDIPSEVAKVLKPAIFGNSDNIRVGETAVAIGNPLGYSNSVTVGVISAVDRELKSQNSLKLIQTDAAINPGNSGGALVNGQGEVIGVNSIKIANEEVEGIGFAIPINSIKPLIEEILSKGYVSRPYLGIYGVDVSKEAAELYEIPVGVLVKNVVSGSGAEKGGLKAGDIIISINDTRINTMTDVSSVLAKQKVGDSVKVKIVRDQTKNLTVTVKLQDSSR